MEPDAPLLGVELRGVGFVKESLKYRDEARLGHAPPQLVRLDRCPSVAQFSRPHPASGPGELGAVSDDAPPPDRGPIDSRTSRRRSSSSERAAARSS
jgi:hypothetical protein